MKTMKLLNYLKEFVSQSHNLWLVTYENDNEILIGVNTWSERFNAYDIGKEIEQKFDIEDWDITDHYYEMPETEDQMPDFYFVHIIPKIGG